MAPTPKKTRFLWIYIALILTTTFVAAPLGYLVGTSNVGVGQLTDRQNSFVSGVAVGSNYQKDFTEWQNIPDDKKIVQDIRAFPETRCAAKYYPKDPIAMSGCIQGISPPPDGRYFIPSPPG